MSPGGGEWRHQYTHISKRLATGYSHGGRATTRLYTKQRQKIQANRVPTVHVCILSSAHPLPPTPPHLCPSGVGGLTAHARNYELGLQRHRQQSAARSPLVSLSGEV